MARRSAFTLIELLVTLVSGSVILIGLASMATQMVTDQRDTTMNRESYYSRSHLGSEVTWTMRQVQRRGLRQGAATAAVQGAIPAGYAGGPAPATGPDLGDTDPYGAARGKRGVITYVRDTYTQEEPAPQLPNDALVLAGCNCIPAQRMTGTIFLYFTTVYRYECPLTHAGAIGMNASTGFNDPAMAAAALGAWMANPANLSKCEVLATGVETFNVFYLADPTLDPSVRNALRWDISISR